MKYPNSLSSKLPKVETTIFSVMSALANEHKAINLSQGFPDFEVSKELVALVNKYMSKGYNQYAPMPGVPELRKVISEYIFERYNTKYDFNTEITVTSGATQALHAAITSIIREDDEVLIFTPAYDSYAPVVELNGGKPVYIQLSTPDYKIDWEVVKRVINHRTRMIIINTPHNPTATLLTRDDMEELEKITRGTNIIILSDEVYEHIVFDDKKHESVTSFPKLAERSFVVFSFGKTFHATGWKMGYCLAPENLMHEFRKVHQYLVFSCNTAVQYAIADFMQRSENLSISKMYQQKRDFFSNAIKDSRFNLLPSSGTYFQLLDYSNITNEYDVDYAKRLTIESGVASIPISVFYNSELDNKVLRFCFAKNEDTLLEASKILSTI